MYEKLLENTGLTKNEAATYLALLKKGKATTYQIVKEAQVSSGKIYETLDKLMQKGLVEIVIENGVKHFIASDPESLFDFLKQKEDELAAKEKELQNILPQLKNLRIEESEPEAVSFVKGFRGISPLVEKALNNGREIRIMGLRSTKDVKFNNFWKKWHRLRIEQKKSAKILFSDKGSDYWRFFKELKYTEVRESLTLSPAAIMIIDKNCFIFSYDEEFRCIHIVSASISRSFTGFFDSLWQFSKITQ